MTTDRRDLKARLRAGHVLFGGWSVTGSVPVAEALALAGLDYVCVDQQHGSVPAHVTPELVAVVSARCAAVVRVPSGDQYLIEKALDDGADGVIAPVVNTARQARELGDASRFPPTGNRSHGSRTRGMMRFLGDPERANDHIVSVAMIETVEAVANIEEICRDGGIDAVYIGLSDLAISMGLRPGLSVRPGGHSEAVDEVARACRRHGVFWGTHESPSASRNDLIERGAQLITVCTDIVLVDRGASAALQS